MLVENKHTPARVAQPFLNKVSLIGKSVELVCVSLQDFRKSGMIVYVSRQTLGIKHMRIETDVKSNKSNCW